MRGRNEVPRLIPEIREAQQWAVQEPDRAKDRRKDRPRLRNAQTPAFLRFHGLVDRTGRVLRVELNLAEGLFVVGDILREDGCQRLRLLRAQVDSLKVVDLHAVFDG